MEAACNRFASAVLLISACLVSPFAKAGAISEPITGNAGFTTVGGAGFEITGPDLDLSSGTYDWPGAFTYTEGRSNSYEIPASGSFQGVDPLESGGTAHGINAEILAGFLDFFSPSSSVPIFSGAYDENLELSPVSLSGTIWGSLLYPPDCSDGDTGPCFDFGPQVFEIRLTGSGTATFCCAVGGSPPQWYYFGGRYVFTGTATIDLTPEPDSLWLAAIGLACIAGRFSSRKRRLLRQSGPGVTL